LTVKAGGSAGAAVLLAQHGVVAWIGCILLANAVCARALIPEAIPSSDTLLHRTHAHHSLIDYECGQVLYTLEDDDDPEAPPLQVVKVVGVSVDEGETWRAFVSKDINTVKVASQDKDRFEQVCAALCVVETEVAWELLGCWGFVCQEMHAVGMSLR